MTAPAIRTEGLSKSYSIHRADAEGRQRAVEKVALRDVDLRVEQGEVLGLVGRNGAGKSTLLKVLSRITAPTRGRAWIRGRVAALLEVGTGMHPDMTGRENIHLNGTLLGMSMAEIRDRFDRIVDFSGVEEYLDAPLKHYSSGMRVRLGFSVAAFLSAEVLIVDEVLAVGDAEFQAKCLGTMEERAQSGKTTLFVSHNLPMVQRICSRAILMQGGGVAFDGTPDEVVDRYMGRSGEGTPATGSFRAGSGSPGPGEARIVAVDVSGPDGSDPVQGGSIVVRVRLALAQDVRGVHLRIRLDSTRGMTVLDFTSGHFVPEWSLEAGTWDVECVLENPRLMPVPHRLTLSLVDRIARHRIAEAVDVVEFPVRERDVAGRGIIFKNRNASTWCDATFKVSRGR